LGFREGGFVESGRREHPNRQRSAVIPPSIRERGEPRETGSGGSLKIQGGLEDRRTRVSFATSLCEPSRCLSKKSSNDRKTVPTLHTAKCGEPNHKGEEKQQRPKVIVWRGTDPQRVWTAGNQRKAKTQPTGIGGLQKKTAVWGGPGGGVLGGKGTSPKTCDGGRR